MEMFVIDASFEPKSNPAPQPDADIPNGAGDPPHKNVEKDQTSQQGQTYIPQGQPYGFRRDTRCQCRDAVNWVCHSPD